MIKLSVVMITYGHEKYIKEAINSIFKQKTMFSVELIIANDLSPDNTDEIIREVISSAPPNIEVKYYTHDLNKGMNANFIWSLKQCTGNYIAFCEGDDYWIDELKLQKQFDFLESNPDFSMHFHESEDNQNKTIQNIETREYSDIEILNNWYIQLASVMCTNQFTEKDYLILKSKKIHFIDLILFLVLANKGKVWGSNNKMSFYRNNNDSITNKAKQINYYIKLFNHLKYISSIYNKKYERFNNHRIKSQAYKIFRFYIIRINLKSFYYLFQYLKN